MNDQHPLAAGLNETVSISTSSIYVWGKPAASAIPVATLTGDSTKYGIFAYEEGTAMVNRTAPARRVGFFIENSTAVNLNASGWALFDAAVTWATGTTAPVVTPPTVTPTPSPTVAASWTTVAGVGDGAKEIANVIAYDPTDATWYELKPLPKALQSPVADIIDGTIYSTTGEAPGGIVKTTYAGNFDAFWSNRQ